MVKITYSSAKFSIIGIFILMIFQYNFSQAQNCGCDFTIRSDAFHVNGNTLNIKPGDTICLGAGIRRGLSLDSVVGAPGNPVVIINCGGKTIISTTGANGITSNYSNYFKITGTGIDTIQYGIEVTGPNIGVYLTNLSSDFEVDHLDVHDVFFAGIMAKTDPNCKDSSTWRENFTMTNINIHDNYVHSTQTGEGLYIGYSSYANGITCDSFTVYPHAIKNALIHHNRTFDTGRDGIQVGTVIEGCKIYNNHVDTYGQRPNGSSTQQTGIQIGEGTGGLCYNNFIKAGSAISGSTGLLCEGLGNNLIYNNIIINAGLDGIFIDVRPPAVLTDSTSGFHAINNDIINPARDGIRTYASIVKINEFKNNIIVNPGSGKYITIGSPSVPLSAGSNLEVINIDTIKFFDPSSDNYNLKPGSPAMDSAENDAQWNIFSDFIGTVRPHGSGFDIGAYEYQDQPPVVKAGPDKYYSLPPDSIILIGSASDPDGKIAAYNWSRIIGDSSVRIISKDSASTKVKNLLHGFYTFRFKATDDSNKSAFDDVKIIINRPPVANAGSDKIINLPSTNTTIIGLGTDPDNDSITFRWTKVSGPSATLSDTNNVTLKLTNPSAGSYIFKLTVLDTFGSSTSDSVVVFVNKPPTVTITQPLTGQSFLAHSNITINVSAMDADGVVKKVEFYNGTSKLSTDTTAPYSYILTDVSPGTYTLTAKAYDNNGASNTSNAVSVFVNKPPTVTITQPVTGQSFNIHANITINVSATDADGVVKKVEFYNGTSKLSTDTTAPYSYILTDASPGTYTLTAKAYDNYGASNTSNAVSVFVNKPPTVTITQPVTGQSFNIHANITINVSATDADGVVKKVEFYNGTSKLSTDTTAPYSYILTDASPGTYTLTAKAYDNYAAVNTSTPVTINVNGCITAGTILREFWANASGLTVSAIPVNTTPTNISTVSIFEGPTNVADQYGARYRGYLCVPTTGNYTFWIASDDNSELWLSTDNNPTNKVRIAYVNGYTSTRVYNKYASQQSVPINLTAGKNYYIEALHKEGNGNDNLSVGWQLPDGTLERPIPGIRLSPYNYNQLPIVSITQPSDNQSFNPAPANITINASASDPDGSIAKVQFYRDTILINTDVIAPYSFTWNNVSTGTYKLTAKAFDNSGGITTSSPITITVGTCSATGTILREFWANVSGLSVSTIPVNTTPTSTNTISLFEGPTNIGDLYGARYRGYICVPTSGKYTFWIASDDNSELWLSTDNNPTNKVRIAFVTGWTNPRIYTKYTSQQSVPINLIAGRNYYIEALHKEGNGNDNLSVGWQLPDGTLERPILGMRLSPFTGPTKLAKEGLVNDTTDTTANEFIVTVHPNPTGKGNLTLSIEGKSSSVNKIYVDIKNIQGYSLHKQQKSFKGNSTSVTITIDNKFAAGMYIVEVLINGKNYNKRLVVE